jgi:hypothetical protein
MLGAVSRESNLTGTFVRFGRDWMLHLLFEAIDRQSMSNSVYNHYCSYLT